LVNGRNSVPIRNEIDKQAGLVRITIEGRTDEQEWLDSVSELGKDPDFRPSMNLLIDVRHHETVASSDMMWKIGRMVGPDASNSRWAIVVSRLVSVGMSNMLSALVQEAGIKVKAFEDMDEAEKWVREGP
jgi:hypothetical protein